MKGITVVGSLNMDYVTKLHHLPSQGETILADGFSMVPGGKGANQAFALGRMGADVSLLGAVGKDADGGVELANLRSAMVDVDHIARVSDPTGKAMVSVDADGNNSIIVIPGANSQVTTSYIEQVRGVIEQSDIILMQLEIPLLTVECVARMAKQMGKMVILDPAPAPGVLPGSLLENVDIIKPNEAELESLTALPTSTEQSIKVAGRRLLDMGTGCVIASLGSRGAYVLQRKDQAERFFSCEDVAVVDTTAAGDSFIAAVAYALANDKTIMDAIPFANVVASVVVTRSGAQSSIPTHEEVEDIWRRVYN